MTTYTGSAFGHVVTLKSVKDEFEIVSWVPPGDIRLHKKASALEGKRFDTLHHAGAAVFAVTHEIYGWPENLKGRSLVFKPEGSVKAPAATTGAKTQAGARNGKTKRDSFEPEAPTLPPELAKYAGKRIPGQKRGDVRSIISVMVNQEGVDKGKTRFWCLDCGDSFVGRLLADEPPAACPHGHVNFDLTPNTWEKTSR